MPHEQQAATPGRHVSPRFRAEPAFDHGKKVYRAGELETIGLSPACFRTGGKRHVACPYALQTDSAAALISQSAATGGQGSARAATAPDEASVRRAERRLIESLITFPLGKMEPGAVPRAFQATNVDWKPSGPHDHIPPLPEVAPKPPHPPLKLVTEDNGTQFVALNPTLFKPVRRPKPPGKMKTIHDDKDGHPKKVDREVVLERLWKDIDNRKVKLTKLVDKFHKEEDKDVRHAKTKITDGNLEDYISRFQAQPLHSAQVKHDQLMRKYAPPLHKAQPPMGKSQLQAATDRLYYQARAKAAEAQGSARKKYVEDSAPKFSRLSEEEFKEMAARLSSKN